LFFVSYRIFYDARYPDSDPAFLALPVLIERILREFSLK
jgi:hypothetical protein